MKYYKLLTQSGYDAPECTIKSGEVYPEIHIVWNGDSSTVAEQVQEFPEDWKLVSEDEIRVEVRSGYFKRLKEHPGVRVAMMVTALSYAAALSNKSLSLPAAAMVGTAASVIVWCFVLISNFRRN